MALAEAPALDSATRARLAHAFSAQHGGANAAGVLYAADDGLGELAALAHEDTRAARRAQRAAARACALALAVHGADAPARAARLVALPDGVAPPADYAVYPRAWACVVAAATAALTDARARLTGVTAARAALADAKYTIGSGMGDAAAEQRLDEFVGALPVLSRVARLVISSADDALAPLEQEIVRPFEDALAEVRAPGQRVARYLYGRALNRSLARPRRVRSQVAEAVNELGNEWTPPPSCDEIRHTALDASDATARGVALMHGDTPGAAALRDGALCMLSLQPLPEPGGTTPREGLLHYCSAPYLAPCCNFWVNAISPKPPQAWAQHV